MTSDDDQQASQAARDEQLQQGGDAQRAEPPHRDAAQATAQAQAAPGNAGSAEPPEGGESPAAARQSRVRIGSQRWREKNPAAKPRPTSEFLPSHRTHGSERTAETQQAAETAESPTAGNLTSGQDRPAGGAQASGQAELSGQAAASAETTAGQTSGASANPSAAESAPVTGLAEHPSTARQADDDKPTEGRRGRRDRRTKSDKVPLVEPLRDRKVAPPNIRAELSPDLEQELAAALGGVSVEAMLSTGEAGVGAELEPESRHRARVVMVHRDDVFVDLGGRRQGVLPLRSLAEVPEPGAMLDVTVSRFNAAEGFYEVGVPGSAVHVEDWSQVSEGLVVEARVTGHNKGGLECEVSNLRGFIPASQVSLYRVEDLSQFVGQKFACVITEANPDKRNLVLSRRGVLEREKAEAKANLLAELEVGQVREAVVRSLQEFGAFVDLGGIDGLVHVSQLSWDRIRHASEVLEVGQKIKVKIQKIDPATGKISLAFRDLAENPWTGAAQKFPPRSRVPGTISRITEFGAFVRLAPGIEGLVHISELSHRRVWRASDVVQEGQEVEVLVLSVDAEHQRIGLSLKALETRPQAPAKDPEDPAADAEPAAVPSRTRKLPLKGGIGHASGGEKFGLKW